MAKFNSKGATVSTKTKNHEGADAYSESPELELASMLLTSFVDDKFYESAKGQLQRLGQTIDKLKDKKFAGKAALFARHEYGMRSISHALIGELAQKCKGTTWLRPVIRDVIFRPDDAIEIIAYTGNSYGKPLPNVIKRGVRDSLDKFDSYQLAKYRKDSHEVKMVDLFNLVHPKPKNEGAQVAYEALMKGVLKSTNTWEAKLSAAGKVLDEAEKEAAKKKAWADMLDSGKLGYFALIRNLRNIIKDCPEKIDKVLEMIRNEKAILNSKLLPFRFLSAYKEIEKLSSPLASRVLDALSDALDISCQNIPDLGGTVAVVVDLSGSMTWSRPSTNSSLRMDELGALMGAMLHAKSEDTVVMAFADQTKFVNLSKRSSVLENARKITGTNVGGGTSGYLIPQRLLKDKVKVDHLCIFTDMQMWGDYNFAPQMRAYKKIYPEVKLYSFDLTGYGTLQMPEKEMFCLAGWSEKVFDLLKVLDKGMDTLIKTIRDYEVPQKEKTDKPKGRSGKARTRKTVRKK